MTGCGGIRVAASTEVLHRVGWCSWIPDPAARSAGRCRRETGAAVVEAFDPAWLVARVGEL
jgi:hypothetical protein